LVVVNPLAFDLWLGRGTVSISTLSWRSPTQFAYPFPCGLKEMSQTPTDPQPRVAIPEMLERQRAIAKARWADPVSAAKWRAALLSPARRAKLSEVAKARWADPAAREKMMTKTRASLADPTVRQRIGSTTKERWADPSMREKMIAGMKTTTKRRRKRGTADC
jgi:hypothetical protein